MGLLFQCLLKKQTLCIFIIRKWYWSLFCWFPQMGDVSAEAVTLDLLREARERVRSSPLGVINTPMIPWCQTTLPLNVSCSVHIKMENMQRTGQWELMFDLKPYVWPPHDSRFWVTGSFKIRGVANQFSRRPRGGCFVTLSAGNYGKSFAYASKHYGSKGKVVMPETAPESRATLIQVRLKNMPQKGKSE